MWKTIKLNIKKLAANKKQLFIFLGIILLAFSLFYKNSMTDQEFWNWYSQNSDKYYEDLVEGHLESLPEVGEKLQMVDKNLTYQFGLPDPKTKKAELIISADGIKDGIPAVKRLVDSAPKYDKWNIVAFRQRVKEFDVELDGLKLSADDVYFKDTNEGEKIGVEFFLRDYDGADKRYIGETFILLDNTIGEYDVMTHLSFIEFHTLNESYMQGLKPLKELPKTIDGKK